MSDNIEYVDHDSNTLTASEQDQEQLKKIRNRYSKKIASISNQHG